MIPLHEKKMVHLVHKLVLSVVTVPVKA